MAFNFSSFFGGFKSNANDLSSINLSEYASIRNGSYKRLAKSYYGKNKSSSSSKYNSTDKKPVDTLDKTGLTKMKAEANELKKATTEFNKKELWEQKDGRYDTEKITKAVKAFVNEYNDVVNQSEKVTSKEVTQTANFMAGMTNAMSKALSKLGISVGLDGKLSIDEDKLKEADVKNIKTLFSGVSSYGAQIEKYASGIESAVVRDTSMYSKDGRYNSPISGMFNKWM